MPSYVDKLEAKLWSVRSSPITVMCVACLGLLIDNLSYSISIACLPHLFEDMKLASESIVGVVSTMFGLGAFITSIISGIASDRIASRKIPMIIGAVGYALSGVILFFASKLWHVLTYRLLNGLASGFLYPIGMSTIGDVYPSKLLGFQMALLNSFNSIGYTVGPVLGGALYDSVGVHGVSAVIIVFGSVLAVVVALAMREPLVLHKEIVARNDNVEDTMPEDTVLDEKGPMIKLQPASSPRREMSLGKLVMQWQVLSASLTTLAMGMLIGSLESIMPIYSKDVFGMSASQIGLLFVINGSVAIVLSVPMGWTVDWMLRRFGEDIRPFIVLSGLALTSGSVLLMGFCTTFTMVLGANTWLAIVILIVNIPVMSSFGDFVNSLGLNSMAQSYGIYNAFWALASTIAPPIATTLYTRIGYRSTVAGLLTGLCIVCSVLIMAEPLWRLCKRAMRTVVERE